jgi:hypothetical protein
MAKERRYGLNFIQLEILFLLIDAILKCVVKTEEGNTIDISKWDFTFSNADWDTLSAIIDIYDDGFMSFDEDENDLIYLIVWDLIEYAEMNLTGKYSMPKVYLNKHDLHEHSETLKALQLKIEKSIKELLGLLGGSK